MIKENVASLVRDVWPEVSPDKDIQELSYDLVDSVIEMMIQLRSEVNSTEKLEELFKALREAERTVIESTKELVQSNSVNGA